jgi:two-component system NarL family sensor kinase
MDNLSQEVTLIVISSAFLLFLAGAIIILILSYQKRQQQYLREKQELKAVFEKELLRTQLEIQEQTFNDISQEIHDNVGQILSLAKVQINIMNESENMSKEMLNEVKENVGKAMSDLRDIAKSLSSERIRAVSIHSSVANEAERINKSGVGSLHVSVDGEERKMDEHKKLILFRIIQESLQNSIKHANASQIDIAFAYLPEELVVTIKDNGKGFDAEEAIQKNSGLGLMNIKTRASLAGGSSSIESRLNKGTTIKINMPYE